jgi:hypothetical protein
MDLPPDLQKRIDELTADLKTMRLPIHIAAATLPLQKDVQEELHAWHAALPLALELEGKKPHGFFVSLSAGFDRLTWQAAGEYPAAFYRLLDYLDGHPIPPENLADLERVVKAIQPEQLGSWILARPASFDVGWYLRPQGDLLANALPYLAASPALQQVLAWAKQYNVTACARFGKSLASEEGLCELYLPVTAPTPRRALETGLVLFRYVGLDFPPDELLSAVLLHSQSELVVSLRLSDDGLVGLGLMLPQPSTELVLRLCDAAGQGQDQKLAIFEGCLNAGSPIFVELQQLAEGWGVELHYQYRE